MVNSTKAVVGNVNKKKPNALRLCKCRGHKKMAADLKTANQKTGLCWDLRAFEQEAPARNPPLLSFSFVRDRPLRQMIDPRRCRRSQVVRRVSNVKGERRECREDRGHMVA